MKSSSSRSIKVLSNNKKAFFNYFLEDRLECGISLSGTEVKSIKNKKFNFNDSYITLKRNLLTLEKFHISPYSHGNLNNHLPERKRTLLAHKREMGKIKRSLTQKGLTIVPTKVYLKNGLIKVEIALAKGKKLYDKREVIKKKNLVRESQRMIKTRYN